MVCVFYKWVAYFNGLPGGSVVKNPPVNEGDSRDTASIPELGRVSGGGNGNPLQYSCLKNPMDRGVRRATVHGSQRVAHDWAMEHAVYLTATTFFLKRVRSQIVQLVKKPLAMQENPVRFPGQEDPLEKEQATHSSILGLPFWLSWLRSHLQCGRPGFDPWVGKIPWRRERLPTPVFWPGEFLGLYSPWGRQVGHDWATFTLGVK